MTNEKSNLPDISNLTQVIDLSGLSKPFEDKDIQWRVGSTGFKKDGSPWATILAYVDSRAVMDRLDDVVGHGNWMDEYFQWEGGVKCRLSIRVCDTWVYKEDGSDQTKVEAFKGGFSKALVRAAVKWGIGRYLYHLPIIYAKPCDRGDAGSVTSLIKDKRGERKDAWLTWKPPVLRKRS